MGKARRERRVGAHRETRPSTHRTQKRERRSQGAEPARGLTAATPHPTSSDHKRRRIGKTNPGIKATRRGNDSRGAVPAPLCDLHNIAAAKAACLKTALASGLPPAAVRRLGAAVGDAISIPPGALGRLHPALRTPGQEAAWGALTESAGGAAAWPTPSRDELRALEQLGSWDWG